MKSKLPENAKLVFRGELWEVYQWPQKMFDGSMATFEGLKSRKNSAKIIAISDGKIVMSKERGPNDENAHYALLGGGIDSNESPLNTAKRELLEEAGLKSEEWEEIAVIDVLNYPRIEFYVYIFLARNCIKIAAQKLDRGEEIELEAVDFNNFISNLRSDKERFGSSLNALIGDEDKIDKLRLRLGM